MSRPYRRRHYTMTPIIMLLTVLILSMLIVRVATISLTLTGVSRELARFQARSAFTGTGFTSSESERVIRHPVRRRIVMLLMLLGNAGIVTVMATLIVSLADVRPAGGIWGAYWLRILILVASLAVLWMVARSEWVDRQLSRVITWALKRWTDLEVRDFAALLHLTGDYVVVELLVRNGDWLVGRRLTELRLPDEGVLVLGVATPDGTYVGAPRGDHRLESGDTVVMYGHKERLSNLDQRPAGTLGNREHRKAIDQQHRAQQAEPETRDGETASSGAELS
jgi:hypothetical protein